MILGMPLGSNVYENNRLVWGGSKDGNLTANGVFKFLNKDEDLSNIESN